MCQIGGFHNQHQPPIILCLFFETCLLVVQSHWVKAVFLDFCRSGSCACLHVSEGADATFDAASELNRVLQTGRCSAQFKSVQSYEDTGKIVNLVGVGNAHPSALFDVLSGAAGSHHVACAERFLLVTGSPVEPHSPLPAGLELPPFFRRFVWAPLLEPMLTDLGLPVEVMQYEYARQEFEAAKEEQGDVMDQGIFFPSCLGFIVTLADGVESRVRYREVRDGGHTWKRPEIRFPNRD